MKSVLRGKLHRVALGVGILILAVGISVSVWTLQRDQGTSPMAGANEGKPAGLDTGGELPRLPARNATVNDSAELDAGGVDPARTAADGVAVSDSVELRAGRAVGGATAAGDATVSDSAELQVRTEDAPAPQGGPGDVASFQDGAELIVRDAEGNIKQQETVN